MNKDIHVFQMKTAHIESVANRQSHRRCIGIPMDEDRNMNALMVQRRRCCASISMDIFAILYVVTTQRRWYCAGIPMDEFRNINARIVQRRWCHASISMDIFAILYVVTTQRRWYCAGIPMDEFRNMNVLISQLGTSCAFDSPGLARNEPTPGKHPQGDSTP